VARRGHEQRRLDGDLIVAFGLQVDGAGIVRGRRLRAPVAGCEEEGGEEGGSSPDQGEAPMLQEEGPEATRDSASDGSICPALACSDASRGAGVGLSP